VHRDEPIEHNIHSYSMLWTKEYANRSICNDVYVLMNSENRGVLLGFFFLVDSVCEIFSDSTKNEQLTQFAHTCVYIYI